MSPEKMKSVPYISVWVTSQTPGTLNACLLTDFQSEKNFISGAEGHSWYLDTHNYLMYIFLFYIFWFCGTEMQWDLLNLKRLDFPVAVL